MKMKNKESKEKMNLSPIQKKRLEEFTRVREELLEQGYKEKKLNVSALKANIMVLVSAAPISLICWLLFLGIHKSYGPLNTEFWLIVFLGAIPHELIHGFTWGIFVKKSGRL